MGNREGAWRARIRSIPLLQGLAGRVALVVFAAGLALLVLGVLLQAGKQHRQYTQMQQQLLRQTVQQASLLGAAGLGDIGSHFPDTDPSHAGADSNGDAEPEVWSVLATSMHGAMLDLKALDPDVHRTLTGRGNERVLRSTRDLAARRRLDEVRYLVVPGVNDSPTAARR